MKIKNLKTIQSEKMETLLKRAQKLQEEIGQLLLKRKTNPSQDTNTIAKLKKELAIVLTVLNENKIIDKLDKTDSVK